MFVGHYGVSFGAKRVDRSIPLWVLFLAVRAVTRGDSAWSAIACNPVLAAVIWWLVDRRGRATLL